jgi:thiamine biosynthesis protein ThiI
MKKIVALLSGGFDSPIAAYLMVKKGFEPIFLSFLTSEDSQHTLENKILQIAQKLSIITNHKIKLYIINHDNNLEIFKNYCERKLTCVLCKRLMIKIAKEIGKMEGTNIIITGDILGEQASQTLGNLYIYNDLLNMCIIIRPLIGFNKLDVIELSQRLELYDLCSQKSASCLYNPQYPETYAKKLEIKKAESLISPNEMIQKSINNIKILEF